MTICRYLDLYLDPIPGAILPGLGLVWAPFRKGVSKNDHDCDSLRNKQDLCEESQSISKVIQCNILSVYFALLYVTRGNVYKCVMHVFFLKHGVMYTFTYCLYFI